MLQEERMKKAIRLEFGVTTRVPHNNGKFYMLMKPLKQELKVSMKNSDSTSTDHSTSDQECQ
jgi:hypothetical protein